MRQKTGENKLNVWLITIGEPLPTDEGTERLMRAGILAEKLVQSEHDVTWWSSTFNHATKVERAHKDILHELSPRYRIYLLHARPYRKNVSLSRIWNHLGLARKFRNLALERSPADLVVTSMPPLELGLESVRYGRRSGAAVILDIRDLWPDIFTEVFPSHLRLPVRVAMQPMYRMAHKALAGADAILGITPEFVDWGLDYAGRSRTPLDRDFPMGYVSRVPTESELRPAQEFWKAEGIASDSCEFVVCMFATFGKHVLLDHVIESAYQLEGNHIKLVMCGSGERLEEYRRKAAGSSSILFPGWVRWPEIFALMQRSSVGLVPYANRQDFAASIPNKPIEYLSRGLPVVSSIPGVLEKLLAEHECGFTYPAGDPKALSDLLLELSRAPDRLQRCASNAQSLFEKRFKAEEVYGRMAAHLIDVVEARRRRTR